MLPESSVGDPNARVNLKEEFSRKKRSSSEQNVVDEEGSAVLVGVANACVIIIMTGMRGLVALKGDRNAHCCVTDDAFEWPFSIKTHTTARRRTKVKIVLVKINELTDERRHAICVYEDRGRWDGSSPSRKFCGCLELEDMRLLQRGCLVVHELLLLLLLLSSSLPELKGLPLTSTCITLFI